MFRCTACQHHFEGTGHIRSASLMSPFGVFMRRTPFHVLCTACNERLVDYAATSRPEPEWMRRRRAEGMPAKDYTNK